jgi:hypothetical protein
VLPAGARCAVRAGFIVSCSVLPTAGRRGGRSRRPCRALSMGRVRQVTTFCETATWAHRSSVAHLVSLHSSYSHRTPREGVRSPSGCDTRQTCQQVAYLAAPVDSIRTLDPRQVRWITRQFCQGIVVTEKSSLELLKALIMMKRRERAKLQAVDQILRSQSSVGPVTIILATQTR